MILIDTNVVSELIRSFISEAGLRTGAAILPDGERRSPLAARPPLAGERIHIHIEQAVPGADAMRDVPGDDLHWAAHPSPLFAPCERTRLP